MPTKRPSLECFPTDMPLYEDVLGIFDSLNLADPYYASVRKGSINLAMSFKKGFPSLSLIWVSKDCEGFWDLKTRRQVPAPERFLHLLPPIDEMASFPEGGAR